MNYIIYNKDDKLNEKIKQQIQLYTHNSNISIFTDYTDNLKRIIKKSNNNVYILNIDNRVENSPVSIAKEIRKYSWDSIIVFITNMESIINTLAKLRIMFFTVISIYDDFDNNLIKCISEIDRIFNVEKKSNILYVHSENKHTYIVKSNEIITSKIAASVIAAKYNLLQVHKSYYVNLKNIKSIDFDQKQIIFKNNIKIENCISARMKEKLKREYSLLQAKHINH